MRIGLIAVFALLVLSAWHEQTNADDDSPDIVAQLDSFQLLDGFIDMYWDEKGGRLIIKLDQFGQPMIYQSSLARGLGSNDIGLDRGQLGATRLVEFQRIGPKILLVERNLDYRAISDNPDEQQAVDESFAKSVVWGFEVMDEQDGAVFVDATEFAIRDSHGIAALLADMEEGEYVPDPTRSALFLPRTKAFPDNSEIESVVTFSGKPAGHILASVVPDPTLISLHFHHSFVRLPDDGYRPLPYDPRAGVLSMNYPDNGFTDYASAIGDPTVKTFSQRHRLEKKNPELAVSEAIEPIVYYVDRGAPEPVRSALMEGASWWNQAFESAGYKDAFRVELLPEGVDPMDSRYNVIQWVHRSTRGWSYGDSVVDPRTGEALRGHVTLGSLRVRQDYLIAEGLLQPYADASVPDAMLKMSLARIRQLAAHEVGHALGLEHNFAASTQDRSSVMDYPFPLIELTAEGEIELGNAYAVGIGAWDKRVIQYAYQDFPDDVDDHAARESILAETISTYKYVSDTDSRGVGTPHPDGNLWDNGPDSIAQLQHLLQVRTRVLSNFSDRSIRIGMPLASVEEVLMPMYLLHRYQIIAVGKLIAGEYFNYALRGDGQTVLQQVPAEKQEAAIDSLLGLLNPELLVLPSNIVELLPPRPPGFAKTRETFTGTTGATFDVLSPAESAVSLTLEVLLDPFRAARLVEQSAASSGLPGFTDLCVRLMDATWYATRSNGMAGLIQRRTSNLTLLGLLRLTVNPDASPETRSIASDAVNTLEKWLSNRVATEQDPSWRALMVDAQLLIKRVRDNPELLEQLPLTPVPPGSPIGTEEWY